MVTRGEWVGDGLMGEGDWEIQPSSYEKNKHRNKRRSIENMVSDTEIGLCADRWLATLIGIA